MLFTHAGPSNEDTDLEDDGCDDDDDDNEADDLEGPEEEQEEEDCEDEDHDEDEDEDGWKEDANEDEGKEGSWKGNTQLVRGASVSSGKTCMLQKVDLILFILLFRCRRSLPGTSTGTLLGSETAGLNYIHVMHSNMRVRPECSHEADIDLEAKDVHPDCVLGKPQRALYHEPFGSA